MKKAAVVILNWNGKKHLETYLPSVIQYSTGYDVIVIDNDSTDDSVAFLKENYPSIEIIINPKNSGFASGYNEGLVHLEGRYEYYILLNSDVEVTENWISPVVNVLDSDDDIVACQPKILSHTNKNMFEHAGAAGGFMDKNGYPFCRGRIFDRVEEDKGQYDGTNEIFWSTGACMFIESKIFHELKGFDDDYFAHMEEIDLCWRIKLKGYKVYYTSNSKVYHLGGGTLDYMSPRKVYLNFRNSLSTLYKNHQGSSLFWKMTTRIWLDYIALAMFLVKLDFKSFKSVVKAHKYFYQHKALLKSKRAYIQQGIRAYNNVAVYKKSIVWSYFLFGKKVFSNINQSHITVK